MIIIIKKKIQVITGNANDSFLLFLADIENGWVCTICDNLLSVHNTVCLYIPWVYFFVLQRWEQKRKNTKCWILSAGKDINVFAHMEVTVYFALHVFIWCSCKEATWIAVRARTGYHSFKTNKWVLQCTCLLKIFLNCLFRNIQRCCSIFKMFNVLMKVSKGSVSTIITVLKVNFGVLYLSTFVSWFLLLLLPISKWNICVLHFIYLTTRFFLD